MKRILVNDQKMNGLSWYRVQGVFTYLEKDMPDVKFGYSDEKFSWREMLHWDIMHFNRATGKPALEALSNIKALGKQVWLDWDDNIFEIDEHHQHSQYFNNDDNRKITIEIIKIADVITVTTNYLKSIIEPYNSNVIVIPNSYNDDIFPFRDMTNVTRDKIVLWRGSHFHRHDLFDFKDYLTPAIERNNKYTWAFMGDDPWFIRNEKTTKSIRYIPPKDAIGFYYDLYKAKPLVVHVPLKDSTFNLAKSNIAMLEAILAGTVTISPNTEEWVHKGNVTYKNRQEYADKLEAFIYSSDAYITKHYNQLVEEVKDKFLLSKNNELRKEIIRNL